MGMGIGKKTISFKKLKQNMMSTTFKENDIRPNDLLKGQQEAVKADIKYLHSRIHEFVNVKCPACSKDSYSPKYQKDSFTIVACNYCETLYTNPRASAEVLNDFYKLSANYDYWNKYIFPASETVRRERIFKKRVDSILDYCKKYNTNLNSILEIGAGFGTFCEEMMSRQVFKRVVAIEPTPSLSQTCRNKGIETIEKTVEQVSFSESETFDVLVNFEVIEHLFSPKDFLMQCKSFLKKGGLIAVTCPNGQGFDVVTLGEISKTVDHEHINYFNPRSLPYLLEELGFEILEVSTPGVLDADIVHNAILNKEFSVADQPFLKKILVDEWDEKGEAFQKFLIENQLSSNMWVIAKNK